MMGKKKGLLLEALLLVAALLLFAQTTWAYFTHQAGTGSVITSGNVKIMLSEAAVKPDGNGNLVEDPESARIFGTTEGTLFDYGLVYPGQQICKDPTVQNVGTNDAYIAAKISVTDGAGDIHRLIGLPDDDSIDVWSLFAGGLLDESAHFGAWNGMEGVTYNERFAMVQVPHRAEGRYDIYIFMLKPFSQGESVTLYDHLYFDESFDNEDMTEFGQLRIDVYGFGVQRGGFDSCYDAMLGALPEYFASFS